MIPLTDARPINQGVTSGSDKPYYPDQTTLNQIYEELNRRFSISSDDKSELVECQTVKTDEMTSSFDVGADEQAGLPRYDIDIPDEAFDSLNLHYELLLIWTIIVGNIIVFYVAIYIKFWILYNRRERRRRRHTQTEP